MLFLDELPEYDRRVLEALRDPLEAGVITIARADARLTLPAQFQLVAAMNPCPCGYLGDERRACRCSARRVQHYRERVGAARCLQQRRQKTCNARLDHARLDAHCRPDAFAQRLLWQVGESLGISARGYHRLLKVARTIADLEGCDEIGAARVGEAASFRPSSGGAAFE